MSTLRNPTPIDPSTDSARRYPIEQDGRVLSMSYEQALHSHRTMGAQVAEARTRYNELAAHWGWLLIQMKRELGHGNFTPFLNRGQVNVRTAQRAMALAEECVHGGRFDPQSVDGVLKARAAKRKDAENPNRTPRNTTSVSLLTLARMAKGAATAPAAGLKYQTREEFDAEAASVGDATLVSDLSDEDFAESERLQIELDRAGDDEFLDEDEGGEDNEHLSDNDGEGAEVAVRESDGGALGLTGHSPSVGAAMSTSSTADDTGPSHRDVGGAGVVGFVGKEGVGSGQWAVGMQLGLESEYALAVRMRDVAGRLERGEIREGHRRRLEALLMEIDKA